MVPTETSEDFNLAFSLNLRDIDLKFVESVEFGSDFELFCKSKGKSTS